LLELAKAPALGASPLTDATIVPTDCTSLTAPASGYIQLIDVARLQECLPDNGAIYIQYRPGTHVLHNQTMAQVTGNVTAERLIALAEAFTIGNQRTFEQDATYGMVVLAEIASKALSPGINDSGTAIAALHSLKKLLWDYAQNTEECAPATASRVFVPCVDHDALLEAAFVPIARDGSGTIEVARHLRHTLADLAQSGHPEVEDAARRTARITLRYFETGGLLEHEFDELSRIEV
jgi:uncharacterized membrane protein